MAGFEIMNSIINKVYLKFQGPLFERNAVLSDNFVQENCFVPLQKFDADIAICKGSISPIIKQTQFPLMLPWACTIHKVQGLSLEEGVLNFDLQKKRTFGQGQMYTALSRVSSYDKLFCVGKFEPSSIKVSVSALQEYERLHRNTIFENVGNISVTDDTITIYYHNFLLLNVRSFSKHACDITCDGRSIGNDDLCFPESQPQHQHLLNGIEQYFENFRIFFNNNDNKFLSLACAFQKDITVISQEDFTGMSTCNFRKSSFISIPLKLMES